MPTGDYLIQGAERACIIERKKNLMELYGNVISSQGRRRFINELGRLNDECDYPVLLLEGDPTPRDTKQSGGLTLTVAQQACARDHLLDLLFAHRIQYAILPAKTVAQRQVVAEWALSTLIAGALRWPPSTPSVSLSTRPSEGSTSAYMPPLPSS